VGAYDTPGEAYGVHVSGSYAYVADREAGLIILEFLGPGPAMEPDIQLSATSHDFGSVLVDSYSEWSFLIGNLGSANLTVSSVRSDNPAFEVVSPEFPQSISPEGRLEVKVRFSPREASSYTGTLTIESNDPDEGKLEVELIGKGVAPEIALSDTTYNFGKVHVDSSSSWILKVFNRGTADLMVEQISSDNSDFSPSPTSFTVQPGGSKDVEVKFMPSATGPESATLTIVSNDRDRPVLKVSLMGTGIAPKISISAKSHDFGSVPVGSSASWDLTVSNLGNAILSVSSVSSSSSEFTLLPVSFDVQPGGSRDVTVTFKPSSRGPKAAVLTILSDDPDEPELTVNLEGVGLAPDISLSASEHDFGDVYVDSSSVWELVVSNEGDIELKVGISSSDDEFTVRPDSFSVAPGGSLSVEVAFRPGTVGSREAKLTVTSDDPDEEVLYVSLRGEGIDAVPPVISHSPLTSAKEGQILRVEADVSDDIQVRSVKLFYRVGGDRWYSSLDMDHTGERYYSTVPWDHVTLSGLEYYIEASDGYNISRSGSPESPHRVPVSARASLKTEGGSYKMIAFSIAPYNGDPSTLEDWLGPYEETLFFLTRRGARWRLSRWAGDGYLEYPDVGRIAPGKAFWVITKEPRWIYVEGETVLPSRGNYYPIVLRPGWNQIGNPFPFEVSLRDCRVAVGQSLEPLGGYLEDRLVAYEDGHYTDRYVLEPWRGYWVKNLTGSEIELLVPFTRAGAKKPAAGRKVLFEIELSASCGRVRDGGHLGFVGGTDMYELSQPPRPPGEYIALYFPHPEWDYDTDFRPESSEEDWRFAVETNLRGEVVLEWKIRGAEHIKAFLLDPSACKVLDMRLQRSYRFWMEGGKREFSVRAGREARMPSISSDELRVSVFPNPFNERVNFEVLSGGEVLLEIYDILGRRVREVRTRRVFSWDGRDEGGRMLSSGVYIWEASSGRSSRRGKVVLVR